MSKTQHPKKSKGTVMAERTRAKTNCLSEPQRAALLESGMQTIYGKGRNIAVHASRN